jgi:hypothetical protein
VQPGQRSPNAALNKSLRHRSHTRLEPDTIDRSAATKSAARLAAEAAFAPPRLSPLPQPAGQVIVRRTRSTSLVAEPAPEDAAGSANEQRTKGSRVFRVESEPTSKSAEKAAEGLSAAAAALPHGANVAGPPPAPLNSHRIASNKRPGPVMHVICALPDRPPEAEPQQPQLSQLILDLQRVTPVLELIARAQTFSLVDERLVREWRRLSRQADDIHTSILAQLR